MAKLGVITDGISLDLEHALRVMQKNGLNQAELQFLGDKEVGDLSADDLIKTKQLVDQYDMQVSCISRHNFAGLGVHEVTVGDTNYNHHMDKLKQCIGMAQQFNAPLVRIMSFRKEMVLFGEDGAEKWNVSAGAWEKLVKLMGPVVELAKKENINADVFGPLAFDNSISKKSASIKGIKNSVAGQADILLVPNVESGNGLVKMMIYFMGACAAGVVIGGRVPVVITSRSDDAPARLASIAAAVVALD